MIPFGEATVVKCVQIVPFGEVTVVKCVQIIAFGEREKKSLNMHVSFTILHRGAIIECFGLSITRFQLFDCIMLNFEEGVSPILDSRNKIKIKYQKCFNPKCFGIYIYIIIIIFLFKV